MSALLPENAVIAGAVLNLIGSTSYVVATIKGKAKPNRVSWGLWALAPLIAFAAELGQGVGIQSLLTFMVGFGPLMVFIASFVGKKAYWKITKFDWWCGGLSLAALALWAITRDGNVAIFFAILADALAAVPTIAKAYKDPKSESYPVFLFGGISAGITLLTIDNWSFANYGFPAYIFAICALMVGLITFPRTRRNYEQA
jgi:hypothetical protein